MSQQTFTFLLFDNTPATPFFELDVLESEEAARRRAMTILNESKRFVTVEVSSNRGVTFTIKRAAPSKPLKTVPCRGERTGLNRGRRRSIAAWS